mgnify:CR=1 FL=1
MLVLHVALNAFRAELALVDREVFAWFEADYFVVLDLEIDAALDAAETAVRLDYFVWFTRVPAADWLVGEVGAVFRKVVVDVLCELGHVLKVVSSEW